MLSRYLKRIANRFPGTGRRIARNIAIHVQRNVFGQPHPWDDLARFADRFPMLSILDLGAHRGEAAVFFARRFPQSTVYAFEPSPDALNALSRRTRTISNVVVEPFAVSDAGGQATLFVNANEQTNSLLARGEENARFHGISTSLRRTICIHATTLDEWATHRRICGPVVIKADIQGSEYAMLQGADHVLRNHVAALLMEVSFGDLYENDPGFFGINAHLASRYGFRLAQLYPGSRSRPGHLLWSDAMWINPQLIEHAARPTEDFSSSRP